MGERQDADVAREADRRLQLQQHDVVVVVQVSGAAPVQRVGDGAGDGPHLLSGLCVPQGVLAQGHLVSAVGAATGWLEETMGPSLRPPSSITPFHLLLHQLQSHPNPLLPVHAHPQPPNSTPTSSSEANSTQSH